MTEDKQIILSLKIENDKALTSLVDVKNRIEQLKKEQAALNTETDEGKKTSAAYQAQITSLSKEQRSLQNAVSQTTGAFNFEAGSIAANRAELSKLTAEYKNLAAPTKAQTDKIKALSDTLKEQEAAIGNTSRNVGNYAGSMLGAGLANTQFGTSLGIATNAFGALKGGIQGASTGFNTLKIAIAGTGIGLLLLAFTALVSYFKQTDDGATALQGIMSGLKAVFDVLSSVLIKFGEVLFNAITSPKQSIIDLGNLIKENILNRFRAFAVIFDAIKSGDFTKITDGFIQLGTGVANASEKAKNLVNGIKNLATETINAAKAAFELEIAFDNLEDAQRDYLVTAKTLDNQVGALLIKLKNRTNTEKESLAIAKQIGDIELENFNKKTEFANKNIELTIDANNLALKQLGLSDAQIKSAKTLDERQKLVGRLAGENAQKEIDARLKVLDLEKEYSDIKERTANRIDAITATADAKREVSQVKELKRVEDLNKAVEDYNKQRIADVEAADKSEQSLANFRNTQRVKLIQEDLDANKAALAAKLADTTLTEEQILIIKKEFTDEQLQIIDERQQAEIIAEQDKYAVLSENEKINVDDRILLKEESEARITDITKKADAERLKAQETNAKKEVALKELTEQQKTAIIANAIGTLASLYEKDSQEFKTLATVQALINTYAAANAALAADSSKSGVFGIISAGAAIVAGLANVAKIQGFKEGVVGLEGRGNGTSDSIPTMLSRGESVMTARETIMFKPQLLQMRSMARNRYATGVIGVNDGGLSARASSLQVAQQYQERNNIIDIVQSLPQPIVLVKDINQSQERIVRVKNKANV